MSQITDILKGHINELLGEHDDLSETRLSICKRCLIYRESKNFGPMCNSSKYISEDGNETSDIYKKGYIKGCGCRLRAKTRLPKATCIIGK